MCGLMSAKTARLGRTLNPTTPDPINGSIHTPSFSMAEWSLIHLTNLVLMPWHFKGGTLIVISVLVCCSDGPPVSVKSWVTEWIGILGNLISDNCQMVFIRSGGSVNCIRKYCNADFADWAHHASAMKKFAVLLCNT